MSAVLPEVVDAWRMVTAQRRFEGTLPLARLPRLADALADSQGECRYVLEFGRDPLGVAYVELTLDAGLPLTCQRTLERFVHQAHVEQRLGLLRDERQEAGLPEGYEPVLLGEEAELRPLELVEDELILALPLVPVKPGAEAMQTGEEEPVEAPRTTTPFAALAALRENKLKSSRD
jgi:uncharacterized protein